MRTTDLSDKSIIFQNMFYDISSGKIKNSIKTPHYNIVQVADSFYLSNFAIDNHRQFCDVEITYVVYNQMDIYTNNIKDVLHQSDLYISLKNDNHRLKSKYHCRFITVAFNFNNNANYKHLLNDFIDKYKNISDRHVKNCKLDDIFTKIVNNFHHIDKKYTEIQLDALISTMLVSLLTIKNNETENLFDERKNLTPRLLSYIDKHYLEIHNLLEISNHFGYSYNYIYKIFKEQTNQTLQQYILNKKMEKAKTLIEEGLTVAKISEILGYSSAYNFSRSFKTFYKMSPLKYKESIIKK